MPEELHRAWGDIIKDGSFIISMCVIWQFFFLVALLSFYPSKMADQAKIVILQTYAVVFAGVVGYWVGVTLNGRNKSGSKAEVSP
jgi:hypothetical protein